jgi:hypothetical protein
MTADDALDRGQPHPGSGKLRLAVEALERGEEATGMFFLESRTVVADVVHPLAIFAGKSAELYARLRLA